MAHMKLYLYRAHLMQELQRLPDFRVQEIQSYVLTTAILARRIDDRLRRRLKSEHVARYFSGQLNFRRLVDLLVHYCRFEPSRISRPLDGSAVRPAEAYFRIYSEWSKKKRDAGPHLEIKLADYFAIIKRIASDDVFVLRHLLAATIKRLRRASAAQGEVDRDDLDEVAASIDDVIWLSRQLIQDGHPALGDIPLQVRGFEIRTRRGPEPADWDWDAFLVDSDHFPTLGSLTAGYRSAWSYMPFPPFRIQGSGYCLLIEPNHASRQSMALPFPGLAVALAEIERNLPTPKGPV